MLRRLFGQGTVEELEAEGPASASMMGVAAPAEEPEAAPEVGARPYQAPDSLLGSTPQREYARFNEPEQVPWPGVYTIADDGISAEYFLAFDDVNGVYVYAELTNAG